MKLRDRGSLRGPDLSMGWCKLCQLKQTLPVHLLLTNGFSFIYRLALLKLHIQISHLPQLAMVVWRGYECVLVDFLNQQLCTLHLSSLVMRVIPIAFCGWTDWVSKSQRLPAVNSWICCKSAMLKRHPIRSENQRRKESTGTDVALHFYTSMTTFLNRGYLVSSRRRWYSRRTNKPKWSAQRVPVAERQKRLNWDQLVWRQFIQEAKIKTNKTKTKKTENKKLRLILKHKKAQRRGRRIRTFHLHFVQKTERTSVRDEGRWVENSRGSVLWIWDSGLSIAARPSLWVLAGDYILGSGQRDIGGGWEGGMMGFTPESGISSC